MGILTHPKRGFRVYTIFDMSKENKKTVNHSDSFVFSLVGCILKHDNRLFETIERELQAYTPFLLEHEFFDDKETRMEFFNFMEQIRDLAEVTKGYSKKELKLILETMSKKALKKLRKEEAHV